MEKAINIKTQEEYDKLINIYDKKWWTWYNWDFPKYKNKWLDYEYTTCIDYNDNFLIFEKEDLENPEYEWDHPIILSFQEFLYLEWVWFRLYEKVEVRNSEEDEWEKVIFLQDLLEDAEYRYMVVKEEHVNNIKKWVWLSDINSYKKIRKIYFII